MKRLGTLLLAMSLTVSAAGKADPPADAPAAPSPFKAAASVPSDVRLYVHVENAAALRRELADRPIARWLNGLFEIGECRKAWAKLAARTGMDEGRLLDICAGTRLTIASRGARQWALVTEVDIDQSTRLLTVLRAQVRQPQSGMGIYELPEQEIVIARDDRTLVIGPAKQQALFLDVLSRLSGETKDGSLSKLAAIEAADGTLGAGLIGVFYRHDGLMGGHSAAVADLRGGKLVIRHAAEFENPPFDHGVTNLTCDFSPVLRFGNHALLAMMQPMDIGDGPVETFMTASLGEGLISPDMRKSLGDRRLLVVGEQEGRELPDAVDLLTTTFVTCLELKDREHAEEHLDDQMVRLCRKVNNACDGALLEGPPEIHRKPGQAREVDLSAATNVFTGGFPIMKNISLNWTVADGPDGQSWFVIGSHRKSLAEVVGVLETNPSAKPDAAGGRCVGKFESCGVGNGRRLERHLQSWSEKPKEFDVKDTEQFQSTLRMVADLAGGLQTCKWQLARPTAKTMRLDVQIELSPPESPR